MTRDEADEFWSPEDDERKDYRPASDVRRANARVRAIVEHAQAHGYDLDHVEILQALDGRI